MRRIFDIHVKLSSRRVGFTLAEWLELRRYIAGDEPQSWKASSTDVPGIAANSAQNNAFGAEDTKPAPEPVPVAEPEEHACKPLKSAISEML